MQGWRLPGARREAEVDPFSFDHDRPAVNLRVDRSEVFPDQSDEEELYSAKEVHANDQGGESEVEGLPPREL
jgi:hypothetical protein